MNGVEAISLEFLNAPKTHQSLYLRNDISSSLTCCPKGRNPLGQADSCGPKALKVLQIRRLLPYAPDIADHLSQSAGTATADLVVSEQTLFRRWLRDLREFRVPRARSVQSGWASFRISASDRSGPGQSSRIKGSPPARTK